MVAEINNWEVDEKAIHLAVSLQEKARTVLGDLNHSEMRNYKKLTSALVNRFGTENQAEMFRATLRSRHRNKDESLPELAQNIKRLTRQAYPSAPAEIRSTVAMDHFIDALNDSDTRWKIRQTRPKTLEDALTLAVELEAFLTAERQRNHVRTIQVQPAPREPTQQKETPTIPASS